MIRKPLFLLLLALPTLSLAAAPAPYQAQYEVSRNGSKLGTATVVFNALPDGHYELRTDTIGSEGMAAIAGVTLNERSLLRWTGNVPETLSYSYRQKLAWKTKERSIQVDAGAGRITSTDKGQARTLKYTPGVLDRNAITVALIQDLAAHKTGDLIYPVADSDSVDAQRYRQAAVETMSTALGPQRAIRVERIRDSGNGRVTTLWFGVDKKYVPLQILQTEANGETIEMRVTAIR